MELRVHRGDFASGWLAPVDAPIDAPTTALAQEFPWESLQAAQRAFDETSNEQLGADEIEMILRWQSFGAKRTARTDRDRSARSTRFRLHAESLERRDVPTPVFAISLLGAALAPAVAAWHDERASQNTFRPGAYIASDRDRRITVSLGAQFLAAQCLAAQCLAGQCLAGQCLASARLAELNGGYQAQPNDSALVELLATSDPSSRHLEPLAWCA